MAGAASDPGSARVTAVVSGGLLVADLGLNVTVWSTPEAVTFGVVGRPELMDVHVLAEAIGPAFERFATA